MMAVGRAGLDEVLLARGRSPDELLERDNLLERLSAAHPRAAEVVGLRFLAGLTGEQVAAAPSVSPGAADSLWAYARAWLFERMHPDGG
jgi:DNA-directed RNA polymerase specialized sigma24 family protein